MRFDRVLLFLGAFVSVSLSGYGEESVDSIGDRELGEVVVKAQRVIPKGDHQLLILSKENRDFGTNALDAVSSLSMFRTSLNDTKLESADHQQVYILINGIPASGFELRGLRGEDIKNVEYYPVAPPRYMTLTSGPVANIVMKKHHDRLYTAYVNTNNAVNTGFGTNQVDLAYSDSLNQVRVGYLIDYRKMDDILRRASYDFGDGRRTEYYGYGKYSGSFQQLNLSYQRFQGRHLFNARVRFTPEYGNDDKTSSAAVEEGAMSVVGENGNRLKSDSKNLAADLYYSYTFRNGGSMAFNLVNTFGWANSDTRLWLRFPAPNDRENYAVSSSLDNRTYSLIASAMYMAPMLGGTFQAGDRYEYSRLSQHSAGVRYMPDSHNNFAYAGICWMKNGKTLFPVVGLNVIKRSTPTLDRTSVIPYFRLYSDIWFQGAMQGATIQLTLQVNPRIPPIGELTGSTTLLDRWFVSMGNPDLKTAWRGFGSLVVAYFQPGGRNNVVLKIAPSYTHNGFAPVISRTADGRYAVTQMRNIGGIFYNVATLYGSWFPWKWLEVSPYAELYTYRYDTTFRKVKGDYFRFGGSLTANHKNLTVIVAANSRTKEWQGDVETGGSAQYAVEVQYKWRDWSFGASWNYSSRNEYDFGRGEGFAYRERKDWRPLENLVRLSVTYSFSKGKARRHNQRILQESSEETGLTKASRARGPQM